MPVAIGMVCLHLQFAERLPFALRGGKLRAQATPVNLRCPGTSTEVCVAWFGSRIFEYCFCFQVDTRASFFSQEIFLAVIENKIHFFLVAFATDF
jgi:hypothetical protein